MMRILFTLLVLIIGKGVFSQKKCQVLKDYLKKGQIEQAAEMAEDIAAMSNPACHHLIGEAFFRKGQNERAKVYFEKALAISQTDSEDQANNLNSLGLLYWSTGNSHQAREYVLQALEIRKKIYGDQHEQIAASYNDLGLVAADVDAGLENYKKALNIYQKLYGKSHQKIAQAKANMGVAYRQLEFYGDAHNHFNEALEIWQILYPKGHPNEGFMYINIGRTYQLMGDLSAALFNYKKALSVYKKYYGLKHPEVASTYTLIGNIHNINGEFQNALTHYQEALIANSFNFNNKDIEANPPVDQYFNANVLLNTLFYKAKALEDLHHHLTLKLRDAKQSLSTLHSADTLIDKIRQISTNEEDKLELGRIASKVYENGVSLCYYMADVVLKKEPYYEMAYYFAEKSKSAVLLEAVSDAAAKSFAKIPDAKLEEENVLRAEITFYEQRIAQNPGEDDEKRYRQQLFRLKQQYELYISDLEKHYPDYYNLKFNVPIPTVAQIQQTLDEDAALISYFISDHQQRLYVFQITKDKFKVDNVPQTENFDRYLRGLRNSIYYKDDAVYQLTAEALYDILFPHSIHRSVNHLIIIPAGRLGTIPYEALLTKSSKSSPMDFGAQNYLINDYAISYQYASALYFQNKSNHSASTTRKGAFLCAPVTFAGLADLPGTHEEVNHLQKVLMSKELMPRLFLQEEASEEAIKAQDFSSYKYLHFATHGVVNEDQPALSKIFLRETSTNDGHLYSGEIYNLQMDAELVTLSACETGLGKVSKGEGIIGLSRALIYAGANNIIVSLWSVADASTSQLMVDFYGKITYDDFSHSLQQAKLSMIKNGQYAHPFYWGPFILIGQ